MRKDAKNNYERILVTARKLQKDSDIKNISMREIAKKANVGVGTLYRNFSSKDTLYFKLVMDNMDKFVSEGENFISEYEGCVEEKLRGILLMYLDFRENNKEVLEGMNQCNDHMRIFYQSKLYERLVKLLERAISPINPQLSHDKILFKADMLIAMLKSDVYAFERNRRSLSKKQILENLIMILQ